MLADDLFQVRLPRDADFSDEELRKKFEDPKLLTGPGRRVERNERYGAAGEYIAAYSDLLLVIADPEDRKKFEQQRAEQPRPRFPDVGAHGIADVRRRGLTPGRLPIRPTLTWADSGPVLRIDAYRRSTRIDEGASLPPAGQVAWLFPLDSCPSSPANIPDDNEKWQARGMRELREIARNIEGLNGQQSRSAPGQGTKPSAIEREWISRLSNPSHGDPPPAIRPLDAAGQPPADEPPATDELRRALQQLGRLRRRVADINAYYDGTIKWLRRALLPWPCSPPSAWRCTRAGRCRSSRDRGSWARCRFTVGSSSALP